MALPNTYREVTYIESTGTQYINTGFTPNSKSQIVMKIMITDYSANSCFFCSRNSVGATDTKSFTAFYIKGTSTVNGHYRFDYYGKSASSSSAEEVNSIIDVDGSNGVLKVGSFTINVPTSSSSSSMPWILLASSTASAISSITNAAKARLYSCKIYDDGVLVRDFVPCMNSYGVYGLYDVLNYKFYKSSSSSNFLGGPFTTIKKGDVFNYEYTGAAQSVTLPAGTYKFEVWGAQGGSYSTYNGGAGGYSIGTWTTTAKSTQLYIYVGGQPDTVETQRTVVPGGFNGGGDGFNRWYSSTYTYGQGGGGGTDIRISTDSLYARIIVAGGGGGSASKAAFSTKYGGGETGGSPVDGYAGSQTSSGTQGNKGDFGHGGAAPTTRPNYKYGPGGAGGGWYGGSANGIAADSPETLRDQNGGGSGYVWTSSTASSYPSGCLLSTTDYLTDAKTYAGNTSFPAVSGGAETGHIGHGYVRITVIAIANGGVNIPVNIGGAWKDSDAIYVNIGGTWKEVEAAYVNVGGVWKELT